MTTIPILTIAIPTFNRLEFLKHLIEALFKLNLVSNVEILVLDNHSSDGTWEWLSENKDIYRLTLRRNPYNLGVEGNILQALIYAKGTYVWLMSDHMVPCLAEIKKLISFLFREVLFTVGYARIQQYDTVLSATYTPYTISEIKLEQRGRLIFNLSNISAVIVHRELIQRSIHHGFHFSKFSYPHLGLLAAINSEDKFVEFPVVSEFQSTSGKSYTNSYNTFKSRFVGFPKAVHSLSYRNTLFKVPKNIFQIKELVSALNYELMCRFAIFSMPLPELKDLFFCVRVYPIRVKFLLVGAIFLKGLPRSVNVFFMRVIMKSIAQKYYEKCTRNFRRACSVRE